MSDILANVAIDELQQEIVDLQRKVEFYQRWFLKSANYIACSAEWTANTKRVPLEEIQRHHAFCEAMQAAITGDIPVEPFDAPTVLARLSAVSAKLHMRMLAWRGKNRSAKQLDQAA
jgi:hypothetical protein